MSEDLRTGHVKLESPSILTKKSFLSGHWGGWAPLAPLAPLVYASGYGDITSGGVVYSQSR